MPPTKFTLNPTYRSGADVVWRFQDDHCGGHLRYRNGMILAILNLYVAPMPPIKFQLSPTYGLGGDVVERFSRWLTWRPFWISEWNDFNNSKSLCGPNAIHQVLGQSELGFRSRCGFKISRWPPRRPGIAERNDFSNFESLCRFDASHQVSAQSNFRFERRYCLKYFKMATMAAILDIGTWRF